MCIRDRSCGLARGLMEVAKPWGGAAGTRARHQREPTAKPGETPASRGSDPPPPGARGGAPARHQRAQTTEVLRAQRSTTWSKSPERAATAHWLRHHEACCESPAHPCGRAPQAAAATERSKRIGEAPIRVVQPSAPPTARALSAAEPEGPAERPNTQEQHRHCGHAPPDATLAAPHRKRHSVAMATD